MSHAFTNRLINETSPYLLQHAHNPVDWYAWGEEALEKAQSEQKVILVSIGYSACHWCHVMEKESFENVETATIMNQHFVNIKIDREERPDLDHIYMDAVQAISGSGGWPLNVFLTPAAKPFYGGTYYPPVKAFNRSSWTEVLLAIATAWQERRNEIESQAENLVAHLTLTSTVAATNSTDPLLPGMQLFTMEDCDTIFDNIMKVADREWGGFGQAPKFPQTFTIQYLLQYQHFAKNSDALQQALLSLDKMLEGGIYDHIAGGMARYSTDREWLAPHFEKMLYDNALMVDVLCDAWLITKDEKYKKAVLKTTRFLVNEMTNPEGGFYAALDADSEGVEGKYYVWQKEELDTILGDDAILFCKFFDVTEKGNWEGVNILRIIKKPVEFASANNIDEAMFDSLIKNCIQKLSAIRGERIRPALDDKIILGWNALALKAIAKAAIVFEDEELKGVAIKNFRFIESSFTKNESSGELLHTYKNGVAKYSGFLDDYAFLIAACFEIYELTFDVNYLKSAKKFADFVINNFSDDRGIFFFFTNQSQKDIIIRKIELYDGAVSSGNSIMAHNLFKLSVIFNISSWQTRSLKMLTLNSQATIKYPSSFGVWASFLLQTVVGLNELAVIGHNFYQLSRKISHNYIPYKTLMASDRENDEFPLLQNKPAETESLIYYCKNYTCFEPVADVNELIFRMDKSLK